MYGDQALELTKQCWDAAGTRCLKNFLRSMFSFVHHCPLLDGIRIILFVCHRPCTANTQKRVSFSFR